jgi:hypothetical protein
VYLKLDHLTLTQNAATFPLRVHKQFEVTPTAAQNKKQKKKRPGVVLQQLGLNMGKPRLTSLDWLGD